MSLLNCLVAAVPARERVITCEEVFELRHTRPDVPRPYRIPGGLPGVWLVGGVGLLGCLASFLLGFVPPSQLATGDTVVYVALLALATVVLSLPPFVFALLARRRGPAPVPAPTG